MKEKIWSWGYVLDKAPTAAPFVFGKTRCSLETASRYLGAGKTFYMNSMFSADFMRKHFPDTEDECIANCIGNRLSESHMKLLSDIPEIYCALEHGRRDASGSRSPCSAKTAPRRGTSARGSSCSRSETANWSWSAGSADRRVGAVMPSMQAADGAVGSSARRFFTIA